MVAYNFQKQFVEPIRSGKKNHTIRKNGIRRHARVGEALQLYTGMRTRNCTKILEPDPVCSLITQIGIEVGLDEILGIWVGHYEVEDRQSFAISDGFESLEAMHEFWIGFHGTGIFTGTMIGWEQS